MKTRFEIIHECVGALRACYNYYSDKPLDPDVAGSVGDLLEEILPATITTEAWQAIADQHAARVAEEDDEDMS
jgi:hypothetical protein